MHKYKKGDVRYTDDHGKSEEKCSLCWWWEGKETCAIVSGVIDPDGWCMKFAWDDSDR